MIKTEDITISEGRLLSKNFRNYRTLKIRVEKLYLQAKLHDTKDKEETKKQLKKKLSYITKYINQNYNGIYNKTKEQTEHIKDFKLNKLAKWLPNIETHWKLLTRTNYIKPKRHYNRLEQKLLKSSNMKKLNTWKGIHTWRLIAAMEEAYQTGKWILYNTLTVDNENYYKVFNTTKPWTEYIRKLNKLIKNHDYFAVREIGQGRYHIHTIHIGTEIPEHWKKDENIGLPIPYREEIQGPKFIWNYGWSTPKPVRFDINDKWSREGFIWPTDKQGNSKPTTTPKQMAFYLAKYLCKELYTKKKEKKCQEEELQTKWRTKRSRNLGMRTINKILNKMTIQEKQIIIASQKTLNLKLGNNKIPPTILRNATLKSLSKQKTFSKNLRNMESQDNIITAQKTLTQRTKNYNHSNLEHTNLKYITRMDVCKIYKNWEMLAKYYFKPISANQIQIPGGRRQ